MSLSAISTAFAKAFRIPFELLDLPSEEELFQVNGSEMLLGTLECLADPPLTQEATLTFAAQDRPGLGMVGFWGYGANSYAFYYSCDDASNKTCLRLPYGGVYTDSERCAEMIADFIPALVAFRMKVRANGASLVAIESMGDGFYALLLADGSRRSHEGSLLLRPDFSESIGLDGGPAWNS